MVRIFVWIKDKWKHRNRRKTQKNIRQASQIHQQLHETLQLHDTPNPLFAESTKYTESTESTKQSKCTIKERCSCTIKERCSCTKGVVVKPSDIVLGKLINTGTFSRVVLATHTPPHTTRHHTQVAVKILDKNCLNTPSITKQEIEIHSSLRHENIVQYLGSYEDNYCTYIVLEYIEGKDLFEHGKTHPNGRIPTNLAIQYLKNIIDGVMYLHKKEFIHRDIKPENILINIPRNIAKLSDFGLAQSVTDPKELKVSGTIYYMAPETISGIVQNYKVDIWAIGLLIYEMLTGSSPFMHDKPSEVFRKIYANNIYYPDYINKDANNLISKMVVSNPANRITLENALKHNWITKTT
jgi:aurora kinase